MKKRYRQLSKSLKINLIKKGNQLLTTIINPENVGIMISQFNKIKEQQNDIERQAHKLKDLNQIYSSKKNVLYITLLLLTLVLEFGGVFTHTYHIDSKRH